MVRAPYTVRIAAGLIVTALEETQKLPTLVVTLPMTALSEALQFGMRLQQGVAGLAIKGDLALELMFDRPSEEPSWARFDDDEPELSLVPTEQPGADALDDQPEPPVADLEADPEAVDPEAAEPEAEKPAVEATGPEAGSAEAELAEPENQVTEPEAAIAEPEPVSDDEPVTLDSAPPAGRFALYSSAPETVVKAATAGTDAPAIDGPVPEVVEYIEYDRLTLAQLRAKLRTVDADDLSALLDYERATKARVPFITMIENRVTAQQKRHSTT
ncbi:lipid droplet-associated protein [Gordonia sp. (in: high G+C Gram-positive bacteria)]|jgi:hypothetical protein|uniref:lipid droplet-associated protein n=1 Tax=Gordonia sp. (in: high G+C Gram-positive bacteria) TaxID=84139 RepID=UPI001D9309AA|nr:lipid droplet-associated protein [Gordonia sp. (in: high G+C Gram-positive bacteria)]MCB1294899.1 lipid droplet-associated protein [Gordonia sp. (in: high G+C Gram-positive bacteria)]HMS74323.1 lipid droplet-associated protein [Gordonia sp. (in: high G+C Gram-positive bacteria)]HQV19543.1 lipid droplet-associated protein [Gordonia sp. (in: high G+C Gram-positive bacteria)]